MKRLMQIQEILKVEKKRFNSFGKYNYRNLEDILNAVKPLLAEKKLTLIINDEMFNLADRFYLKAIAIIYDENGKEIAKNTAVAREELTKKGMSADQLSGAVSSYARKYALNGLFLIDDSSDADTMSARQNAQGVELCSEQNLVMLRRLLTEHNTDVSPILNHFIIKSLSDLPYSKLSECQSLIVKLGKK